MRRIQDLTSEPKIAYFSMEIGFRNDIPTYSGGLGVLAGDTIKSASDLNLPMVAVTLLYRKGYFMQEIDQSGRQIEHPVVWNPDDHMTLLPQRIRVRVEGRDISVQVWQYDVCSLTGGCVPIFFLDTDVPENSQGDKELTHYLYGGDDRYRLKQELILLK